MENNPLSQDEQIEQHRQQIEGIIEYLRDIRRRRSLSFALFRLHEIAQETEMEQSLHDSIKYCLENPEKEIKVNFKKKEK